MKICSKCKIEKELNEFWKSKSHKNGFYSICKKCASKSNKKWIKFNHEKKVECDKKHQNGKANYDTYALQISYADKVKNVDGLLQTKCTYCGKWYFPTAQSVKHRIKALNGKATSEGCENRLYCSTECKQACPIYRKVKFQDGHPKKNSSREVQPELRQIVFERDNYTCLKCGKHQDKLDIPLHCHHIEGILWNPLESTDIDQCMTVCKNCHNKIHKQTDCGYSDLQCKEKI